MELNELKVGIRLEDKQGKGFRVLHLEGLSAVLVQTDVEVIRISVVGIPQILDDIRVGNLLNKQDVSPRIIDKTRLPDSMREEFEKKLSFVSEFNALYGPDFSAFAVRSDKASFKELYRKHEFSKSKAYRIARRWLQSGFQESAIMDKRFYGDNPRALNYRNKTGNPSATEGIPLDDDLRKKFDYGIKEYRSGRLVTQKRAYESVIFRFFTHIENGMVVCDNVIPTEKQFYNYLCNVLSSKDRAIIKTSEIEFRNNERLLLSTPAAGAVRPGSIVEVDALEVDLWIVSEENKSVSIGRPILYMMIDLFSHCIVAFYVGFENNSMKGLTSLMANLLQDKEQLLREHNISMDTALWPSCFIPSEVRCDRGSDFASEPFRIICSQMGILRTLEPGASGSLKSSIERSFRTWHDSMKPQFEKMGVIQKRYDSKHMKEACLTIEDVFMLIVLFIGYHNSHYEKDIYLPLGMPMGKGFKKPIEIWKFGAKEYGIQTPVTSSNYNAYLYQLMTEVTASITRQGIKYEGLLYANPSDEETLQRMQAASFNSSKKDNNGISLNSMKVRIDPRNINRIYYLSENPKTKGELRILSLIPGKNGNYRNITWEQYERLRSTEKQLDKEGRIDNLNSSISVRIVQEAIAEGAKSPIYATPFELRTTRAEEKQKKSYADRLKLNEPADGKEDWHSEVLPSEKSISSIPSEPNDPIKQDLIDEDLAELISPWMNSGE